MSFSGPTAPRNPDRERIPADLFRLLLAMLTATAVTAMGTAALFVSTLPPWISYCVQPFSLLLIPGYTLETLDRNSYAFSINHIIFFSCAFYFSIALLLLFRKPAPAVEPPQGDRLSGHTQPSSSRHASRANR